MSVYEIADAFPSALYGEAGTPIPEECDWFAPLIGDWDFDYYDGPAGKQRHVVGEWIFRRVLNGTGIEDLFICPSRATRESNPQPDGAYGVAIRMFNPREKCYDMVYTGEGEMARLRFVREDDKLVGTVLDRPAEKWAFVEIKADSFHWQNVTVLADGTWQVNANVYARRRG